MSKITYAWVSSLALVLLGAGCGGNVEGEDASESSALSTLRGVDYSFGRPSPGSIKSAGYHFVSRYVSDSSGKNISKSEADALIKAGLDIVINWENDGHDEILRGYSSGVYAATNAARQAKAVGQPTDKPIYFSVDFDAQPSQQGALNSFFDGAASVIGRKRVGAYGSYGVVSRLFNAGKITYAWQAYAWSYGKWDPRAQVRQIDNGAACGGSCDIDEAVKTDFGQWGVTKTAPPKPKLESVVRVYRPSNTSWYTPGVAADKYGATADVPVAADYDGNAKMDIALWRPSTGAWYIPGHATVNYGGTGDIPVQADYTGDGKADIAVWRPSNGNWYIRGVSTTQWGVPGDVPVPADYDGNGKANIAIWRPSTGTWYLRGLSTIAYGAQGDIPVPGDYNGDGKADLAVWRPSNGTWYIRGVETVQWGEPGDIPVPGDYNGDGKTDLAVWRPSTGTWYIRGIKTVAYGDNGDVPAGAPMNRIDMWRLARVTRPVPTLKCPASITAQATGPTGGKATFAGAVMSDLIAKPAITYSHASGGVFPLGVTAVKASLSDAYGATASCSFNVTVKDTTPPKLTCPADMTVTTADAMGAAPSYVATVTDAVSATTVTYEPAQGSMLPMGDNTVQVTADDKSGNTSTCSFGVHVDYNGAPQISCPASLTVDAADSAGAQVDYPDAEVADHNGTANIIYSDPPGALFPVGSTSVTATALDEAGHQSTCTFTVTVNEPSQQALKTDGALGCSATGGAAAPFFWAIVLAGVYVGTRRR